MHVDRTKVFYVCIMASGPQGVPYVGMTSELAGRAWEHRERVLDGFTKRYWEDRLVYFERHEDTASAARLARPEYGPCASLAPQTMCLLGL